MVFKGKVRHGPHGHFHRTTLVCRQRLNDQRQVMGRREAVADEQEPERFSGRLGAGDGSEDRSDQKDGEKDKSPGHGRRRGGGGASVGEAGKQRRSPSTLRADRGASIRSWSGGVGLGARKARLPMGCPSRARLGWRLDVGRSTRGTAARAGPCYNGRHGWRAPLRRRRLRVAQSQNGPAWWCVDRSRGVDGATPSTSTIYKGTWAAP